MDDIRIFPPALTPEARENELISLAMDLAERQLRDGTASPTVINHYLRLATEREKLEREKLAQENRLLQAKTETLESSKRVEELYRNALDMIRAYTGNGDSEVYDDPDLY